jgi:spore coat protein SA
VKTAKPKVAVITPGTFSVPSSRMSSVETVVDMLTRIISGRADFYVFSKKTKGFSHYIRRSGITHIRLSFHSPAGYLDKVTRHLASIRPDIIQVENRPRFVPLMKRKFPHARVLLSLHSTTFISEPYLTLADLKKCLRQADKILVNSAFLKEHVSSIVPAAASKIVINHLGVDVDHFASRWTDGQLELRRRFLAELGYSGKKIILFAGRLLPIKGVHHLLNVMPKIAEKHPEAIAVIVGSAFYGTHKATPYVRMLHSMGSRLPANVRFVPFVPHERIHDWFRIADMAVVPSAEKEAFGLVNVEAMATGVPVISTKVGGMREVVVDGQTGYLIDPSRIEEQLKDCLLRMLDDEQLAKRLGEAGVERVKEMFTWRHTAERLWREYL